jgi:hypothetical protein
VNHLFSLIRSIAKTSGALASNLKTTSNDSDFGKGISNKKEPISRGDQHGIALHPPKQSVSKGIHSDTEYGIDSPGLIRRDSRGNKIRYSDPASDKGTDELDNSANRERETAHLQQDGHAPA